MRLENDPFSMLTPKTETHEDAPHSFVRRLLNTMALKRGLTTPNEGQRMTDIGIETRIGELQKTVIVHTARILRKVLEV